MTKLRLSLLKPGAVVDQRRGVIDVVMGSTMHRAVLQAWDAPTMAHRKTGEMVPGRWVDVEIGEDDQKMPEPEVGI